MNQVLLKEQFLNSFRNDVFELIILPTEQCNFRCTYCYENFEIRKMSKQTVNGIKNFLTKKAAIIQDLHISWFGGEPLLAIDIIEDISKYILRLNSINPRFFYKASITTNGYLLTKKNLDKLFKIGVKSFQISLDGDSITHNQTRIRYDGYNTFERIWSNLLEIKKTNFDLEILLRIHILQGNIDGVKNLIKNLNKEFLCDERFSILLKPIAKLGGKNDNSLDILENKKQMNAG